MSRFEEVVNDVIGEVVLGESGFKAEQLAQHIAEQVRERQDARRAEVTIAARYPEHKPAPVSGIATQEIYTLFGSAVASERGTRRLVGVAAQGMTACPCAQGLVAGRVARAPRRPTASPTTRSSASSRRCRWPRTTSAAWARCYLGLPEDCETDMDAAELLAIVEDSMSSEIYELMKRSDEGAVVEKAHRRPRFVEDCVREAIRGAIERFGEPARRRVRLRAPGEPRDDPSAQRRRRALRAARRAAPRARRGRARRASHVDARVARRRRLISAAGSGRRRAP